MGIKVDFKKLDTVVDFNGKVVYYDVAEMLGNLMMFDGATLLDIGFEDLARTIYYSTEEVEVPQKYINAIVDIVRKSNLKASIKRSIINHLTA